MKNNKSKIDLSTYTLQNRVTDEDVELMKVQREAERIRLKQEAEERAKRKEGDS